MKLPSCAWPFGVASRDAHHIAMIFVAKILVLIDQRLPHAGGVLLVHAEDNGLLETIATLFQKFGDFAATSFVRSSMTSVRSKSFWL